MKVFKIVLGVIFLHVFGAILLIQSGCKSPDCRNNSGEICPLSSESLEEKSAVEVLSLESYDYEIIPQRKAEPPRGASHPTRPQWNIADGTVKTKSDDASRSRSDVSNANNGEILTEFQTYTVVQGDSLWKIAKKFNISLNELLSANSMSKNAVIQPGYVLHIPQKIAAGAKANLYKSPSDRDDESAIYYEVKTGDTLSKIAMRNGVTVSELQSLNHLTTDSIRVGQKLKMLSDSLIAKENVSKHSDSMSHENKSEEKMNLTSVPLAKNKGVIYHVVESGETLSTLAKRFGVSASDIIKSNHIQDPNRLKIGQKLVIQSQDPSIRNLVSHNTSSEVNNASKKEQPVYKSSGTDSTLVSKGKLLSSQEDLGDKAEDVEIANDFAVAPIMSDESGDATWNTVEDDRLFDSSEEVSVVPLD